MAHGISFGYGETDLFTDISFEIPQGQVYGLLGASGIGKTTLLNLVLGLFRPRTGSIRVAGLDPASSRPVRGAVFREMSLLAWLTVEDNIAFPLRTHSEPALAHNISVALAAAGLEGSAKLLPKELSAGMSKRVELLRAWHADNNYFIGDEPFSTLDFHTRGRVQELWLKLRAELPRTGLLCTHDPREAALLCDRVLILRRNEARQIKLEEVACPAGSIGADTDRHSIGFIQQVEEIMR